MEDWIDLTNYREHPSNKNYQVFHFSKEEVALYFKHLLDDKGVGYEEHQEQKSGQKVYYFAIHKRDMVVVKELNHLAIGHFRSKFIPDLTFRWLTIGISVIIVLLAILGYLNR